MILFLENMLCWLEEAKRKSYSEKQVGNTENVSPIIRLNEMTFFIFIEKYKDNRSQSELDYQEHVYKYLWKISVYSENNLKTILIKYRLNLWINIR